MQIFEEGCSCGGQLFFTVRHLGKVLEEYREKNMIMTAGRVAIAKLFAGQSGMAGTHVGVGTSGEAPAPDQEGLENVFLVSASAGFARGEAEGDIIRWVASEEPTPNVKFDFLIGTEDANGMAIREFGLFCGDGTMFSRRVRTNGKAIDKDGDIEIEGYWIIRF